MTWSKSTRVRQGWGRTRLTSQLPTETQVEADRRRELGICEEVEAAGATPTRHTHSGTALVYEAFLNHSSLFSAGMGSLREQDWLCSAWYGRVPGCTRET